MGTSTVTYVTDYAGLISLPAGTLLVDNTTGSAYRVCQGQYGTVQVVQLTVQGSARVVGAPTPAGKPFAHPLMVVHCGAPRPYFG